MREAQIWQDVNLGGVHPSRTVGLCGSLQPRIQYSDRTLPWYYLHPAARATDAPSEELNYLDLECHHHPCPRCSCPVLPGQ